MAAVLTVEPKTIRAGDTIAWTKSLSDYPANTYVLTYRLINGTTTIDLTASASGTDHVIEITAGESAFYVAGEYTWFSFVTAGAERTTVSRGTLTVLPDMATATEFRSSIKIALDAMKTAIATFGNRAYTQEYQIAGRVMRFRTNEEFITYYRFLQSEYLKECDADNIAQGLGTSRRVGIRFRRL